jgi:hypothetical protein
LISIMERNAAISSMMQFVGNVTPDRETQLSLFASALVTACIEFDVSKETALAALEHIFNCTDDLVTLERPRRLN